MKPEDLPYGAKLDIGCGDKKAEGFIGIDKGDFSYPEDQFIRGDVFEILPQLKDSSVTHITSDQFIEHIPKDKFIFFMNECYRILTDGGFFEARFPPAITQDGKPNPSFYADPTHCNHIIGGTFYCFSKKYRIDNNLEKIYETGYGIKADFDIIGLEYYDNVQITVAMKKL